MIAQTLIGEEEIQQVGMKMLTYMGSQGLPDTQQVGSWASYVYGGSHYNSLASASESIKPIHHAP